MAKKKFLWCTVFMIVLVACLSLAACVDNQEPSESQTGSEVGEYYYETESGEEYLLSLNEDGSVSFSSDTELSGSYTISDETLTLTFGQDGEDDLVINASYENGTVTLTYEGTEMQFLEKMYYTVTFETNGGTAIDSVQVLNGKTVAEPEKEPSRTNYEFLGWYKDSACSEPFDFTMEKITANTTVYAKWESFNTLTYDGESGVSGTVVVNDGKNYTLSVPAVEDNYIFVGWFTEDGTQLTDGEGDSLDVWDATEYGNITVYAHSEMDLVYTELTDGTGYSVSGKTETADAEILDIPATHNGKPIIEVLDFAGYTQLTSVRMPESVTYIQEMAFDDAPLLASFKVYSAGIENPVYSSEDGVIFGDGGNTLVLYPVAKTGDNGCYKVPAGVIKIAPRAFYEVMTGEEYNPTHHGVLKKIVFPSTLAEIGEYAFYERDNLRSVVFEDGSADLKIGAYAFAQISLEEFNFPARLKYIGDYAFYANYLASPTLPGELNLPEGLLTIGAHAFDGATWLETITVPESVTSIGEYAFNACYYLQSIELKCNVTAIPDGMLANTRITTFTIPSTVLSIGDSAFEYCSSITELNLPQGLVSIGNRAFASMRSLTKINIPSTVTTFGSEVFSGCSNLNLDNVTVGEGCIAVAIESGVLYSGDMKTLLYYPANNTQTEYVMPDTVENIPNDLFNYHTYVTSVKLSSNLKEIPRGAFKGSKVTSITIPASVMEIGEEAFAYASSLTELKFESGSLLETIAADAFNGCSGLTGTITLPEGLKEIGASAFENSGITGVVLPGSLTEIGERAFRGAKLESVTLPGSLRTIGADAFSRNQLLSVQIEEGITYLPENCFASNSSLLTVILPTSLEEIADGAFSDCTSLENVTLPESLLSLGVGVFSGDVGLQKIEISTENGTYTAIDGNLYNKAVTVLLQYAIGKTETGNTFILPDSVTTIGAYAFSGSSNLVTVNLNNAVSIEDYAFENCNSLSGLIGMSDITTIGSYAFKGCTSLASVDLSSVVFIGAGAFYGCSTLKNVANVKVASVPEQAFANCTSLTGFDFSMVTMIGDSAFSGCTALFSVVLGDGLVSLGTGSFRYCSALKSISIPGGVKQIPSFAFSSTGLTEVEINEGVESIGSWAFSGVFGLTSIEFPSTVKSIASGAFERCLGLERVVLPAGLEQFDWQAFDRADRIKEYVIDERNPYYKTIDGNLYSKDGTVLVRYAVGKEDASFTIPEEVTTIAAYAFYSYWNNYASSSDLVFNFEQKLKTIIFSENIKVIEDYALMNCRNLNSVTIGSQEVLNAITGIVLYSDRNYNNFTVIDCVETIIIKGGLTIPAQISENFTAEETVDGYTTYTRNSS